MCLVSVIVPCFNVQDSVVKTLDSLRNQTLKDLEVIAVNDGSTDNTLQVLNQYRENHPAFSLRIYSKENEGIAQARNFGLSKVTGQYFGFLDSDDYAESTMFEEMVQIAENQQLDLVVSNFWWEDNKGQRLEKEGPYVGGQEMMVHLFAVLWNKLYRTSWIQSLDITFPKGDRYEDACYLYCLCMHTTKTGFMNKAYVHYVQHPQSITHDNGQQVKNMIHVFQTIVAYYQTHETFDKYKAELEYIHIKFFLGNNFLRGIKIEDRQDRYQTIWMGWNLLNQQFPDWHKNMYLKTLGGLKNRYFSLVRSWNLNFFIVVMRLLMK